MFGAIGRYAAVMLRLVFLLAPILLTACSKADNDPGPGGVTISEARALDEAAEMIEPHQLPPQAIPSAGNSSKPTTKTGG